MSIQKGPRPVGIVPSNNPLGTRENEYQQETGVNKGFKIDMGGKMPSISYETKQSGKIGSFPASTVKPTREVYDIKVNNPEENFHTQYVKEGEISHSPGAFNK